MNLNWADYTILFLYFYNLGLNYKNGWVLIGTVIMFTLFYFAGIFS